jgi:hypothetical protein
MDWTLLPTCLERPPDIFVPEPSESERACDVAVLVRDGGARAEERAEGVEAYEEVACC